jgi:hypothetical protein
MELGSRSGGREGQKRESPFDVRPWPRGLRDWGGQGRQRLYRRPAQSRSAAPSPSFAFMLLAPCRIVFLRGVLASGAPIPARLPPDTPVFNVPRHLAKILNRDLVAAGKARRVRVGGKWAIDKRDDRGRTTDVHALRTTFSTLLSKGGVGPRTTQAAMRHSDIRLTTGVYIDPILLDVREGPGHLAQPAITS